jgi:hypothetical protein
MAHQPTPNDPYRPGPADENLNRQSRLDNELQADPELAAGPANGTRVAMFALAIAVVLGAVFYGLNSTSMNPAGTTPSGQTAQTQPANPPAAPPGMRDVTPGPNTAPGTTTGAATNRPTPPAPNPTGTGADRTATPPVSRQ